MCTFDDTTNIGIRRRYITEAISNAHESKMQSRHGAIVFAGGKIIGSGCNSSTRNSFDGVALPAIHAEMQCIKDAQLKRQCFIRAKG